MLGNMKSNLVRIACSLGGYQLVKLLMQKQPRILMYHRFGQDNADGRIGQKLFEQQVMELKKGGFNIVPLSIAASAIRGEIPMQKNMIVLTIDDGYADFYRYAYPILKKHGLPATFYVTTGFVDRKLWLWPDRLTYILEQSQCYEYIFAAAGVKKHYDLKNEGPYGPLWQKIVRHCLALPDEDKNNFLDEFASALAVEVPAVPIDDYTAVTWEELKEMAANGIEIGAHTITHPAVSKINPENLTYEIDDCKKRLEEQLGIEVSNFCYPNGQPTDYNHQVMQAIEAAGFKSATVAFTDSTPYCGIYELRRHNVDGDMFQFHKVIYGVEALGRKIKNTSR